MVCQVDRGQGDNSGFDGQLFRFKDLLAVEMHAKDHGAVDRQTLDRIVDRDLAAQLGLNELDPDGEAAAQMLSGNVTPTGARPIAQAQRGGCWAVRREGSQ